MNTEIDEIKQQIKEIATERQELEQKGTKLAFQIAKKKEFLQSISWIASTTNDNKIFLYSRDKDKTFDLFAGTDVSNIGSLLSDGITLSISRYFGFDLSAISSELLINFIRDYGLQVDMNLLIMETAKIEEKISEMNRDLERIKETVKFIKTMNNLEEK